MALRDTAALVAAAALTIAGTAPAWPAATAYPCMTEPKMVVKLGSQAAGILSRINVDRGDFVKAGDVIATLESSVEMKNLVIARERASNDVEVRLAKEAVALNETLFNRRNTLVKTQAISEEVYDKALNDLKMRRLEVQRAARAQELARLEAERAEALLELRTIRSPIDGVIVSRKMSPGEFVRDESQIVEIAQVHPIFVHAFLPVSVFRNVQVGTRGLIEVEEAVGGIHRAAVRVKDPLLDAASSTFLVRFELPNPDRTIPSGARCTVVLGEEEKR